MEYSNSHLREVINEYVHSERDRKILIRKYIDDVTLERLAEEFDLSVSQVKRVIKKHCFTVFRHLEDGEPKRD